MTQYIVYGLSCFLLILSLSGCDRSEGMAPFIQGGSDARYTNETSPTSTRGQYFVQKGDTVYSISRTHGLDMWELISRNNLTPPYHIFPGQPINLSKEPLNRNQKTHTVKKGETVYSIGRKHHIPIRSLIEENNLRSPYILSPGQHLRLPRGHLYIIKKGDTLYSISREYATDMHTLLKLNQLDPGATLKVGDVVILPTSDTASKSIIQPSSNRLARVPSKRTLSAKEKRQKQLARKKLRSLQPARRSRSKFLRPVSGQIISGFGPRKGGLQNDGINIRCAKGAGIRAAENGIVVYAGQSIESFGNLILIKHADGWVSAYGHLDSIKVKQGAKVSRGETIGLAGNSGHVKTPQLHFELRKKTKTVNPTKFIS